MSQWAVFITDDGAPATGLTPAIDVYEYDGTQVVAAAAMTEAGDGWYTYTQAGFDDAESYLARIDAGAGVNPRWYQAAKETSREYTTARAALLDNLDLAITTIQLELATHQGSVASQIGTHDSNMSTLVGQVDTVVDLIQKVLINRLELADGAAANWILYDTDDVTPLLTFNVTNKVGGAILIDGNAPARRSRGS